MYPYIVSQFHQLTIFCRQYKTLHIMQSDLANTIILIIKYKNIRKDLVCAKSLDAGKTLAVFTRN